mmetsp:Transcript_31094/g.101339  ORF Transcript_31094/g.101339 Transcript_31094/m.101339 type:complete len:497 (-) Transcript_31094:464-1954(-)
MRIGRELSSPPLRATSSTLAARKKVWIASRTSATSMCSSAVAPTALAILVRHLTTSSLYSRWLRSSSALNPGGSSRRSPSRAQMETVWSLWLSTLSMSTLSARRRSTAFGIPWMRSSAMRWSTTPMRPRHCGSETLCPRAGTMKVCVTVLTAYLHRRSHAVSSSPCSTHSSEILNHAYSLSTHSAMRRSASAAMMAPITVSFTAPPHSVTPTCFIPCTAASGSAPATSSSAAFQSSSALLSTPGTLPSAPAAAADAAAPARVGVVEASTSGASVTDCSPAGVLARTGRNAAGRPRARALPGVLLTPELFAAAGDGSAETEAERAGLAELGRVGVRRVGAATDAERSVAPASAPGTVTPLPASSAAIVSDGCALRTTIFASPGRPSPLLSISFAVRLNCTSRASFWASVILPRCFQTSSPVTLYTTARVASAHDRSAGSRSVARGTMSANVFCPRGSTPERSTMLPSSSKHSTRVRLFFEVRPSRRKGTTLETGYTE